MLEVKNLKKIYKTKVYVIKNNEAEIAIRLDSVLMVCVSIL